MTNGFRLALLCCWIAMPALGAEAPSPTPGEKAVYEFWAEFLKGRSRKKCGRRNPRTRGSGPGQEGPFRWVWEAADRVPMGTGRKRIRIEAVDPVDTDPIVMAVTSAGRTSISASSPRPLQRIRIFFPDGKYQYEWIDHRFAGESDGAGSWSFRTGFTGWPCTPTRSSACR